MSSTAADLSSIRSVPVFPLAGALLLPRGSLPLHIFEPRYLAMVDDAMSGNQLIGMVQPRASSQARDNGTPLGVHSHDVDAPALYSIGCVGRITARTQTPDGRNFITLTGISRFVVVGELELQRGYRRAQVRWEQFAGDLNEDDAEAIDDGALRQSLRSYFNTHSFDTDWDALQALPTAALVNLLAMMCPFEPPEKQALLEAYTLADRASVLTVLLDLDSAATVPPAHSLQ